MAPHTTKERGASLILPSFIYKIRHNLFNVISGLDEVISPISDQENSPTQDSLVIIHLILEHVKMI